MSDIPPEIEYEALTTGEMFAVTTALSVHQDPVSIAAREKLMAVLDPQLTTPANIVLPPGWRHRNEEFAGVPIEVVLEANPGVDEDDLIVVEGIVQVGSNKGLPPIAPEEAAGYPQPIVTSAPEGVS